jgi:hypothetical protein
MDKRNTLNGIIVGLVIFSIIGLFGIGCAKKAGPHADLLYRDGTALIKKHGTDQWLALSEKTPIEPGDELMTKESGTVEIGLGAENFVKIGPNTHVKVNDLGMVEATKISTNRLEIVFGKLRAVVAPFVNKESSFTVEMNNATVGVRGTDFGFIRDPEGKKTTVLCLDGEVMVESLEEAALGKKPSPLPADRTCELVAGESPSPPAKLGEGLKREFIREMDFVSEKAREHVREDLRYTGVAAPGAETYTVSPGDSLWKIARDRYGKGEDYPIIYDDNRDTIADPDLIYPGAEIHIPQK